VKDAAAKDLSEQGSLLLQAGRGELMDLFPPKGYYARSDKNETAVKEKILQPPSILPIFDLCPMIP
jgi:hypothetical protein